MVRKCQAPAPVPVKSARLPWYHPGYVLFGAVTYVGTYALLERMGEYRYLKEQLNKRDKSIKEIEALPEDKQFVWAPVRQSTLQFRDDIVAKLENYSRTAKFVCFVDKLMKKN